MLLYQKYIPNWLYIYHNSNTGDKSEFIYNMPTLCWMRMVDQTMGIMAIMHRII